MPLWDDEIDLAQPIAQWEPEPIDLGGMHFDGGIANFIEDTEPLEAEAAPLAPIEGMEESFPEYPNFISLDRYMVTPKLIVYEREIEPNILCLRGVENFTIRYKNKSLIAWGKAFLTLYSGDITSDAIKALDKYSGKMVKVFTENGVWMVTAGGATLPFWDGMSLNLNDFSYNNLGRHGDSKRFYEQELESFKVVNDKINKYLYKITPEAIANGAGNQTSKNRIYTQCVGCNGYVGSHLHSHIERYEINPWLIWNAWTLYGEKDAITRTWNCINKAREGALDPDLKTALKFFLRNSLSSLLTFSRPSERSNTRWNRASAHVSNIAEWNSLF